MKKLLTLGLFLSLALLVQAQSKIDSLAAKFRGNNELKINLLYTAYGFPSIVYERILFNKVAAGLSATIFFNGAKKDSSNDYRQEFNPYVRYYVAGKRANGFFLEGNFIFVNREDYSKGIRREEIIDNGIYSYPVSTGIRNSYGIAGGIGAKFLVGKGFVGEVNFGMGQLLGDLDGKRPKSTGFLAGIDEMYAKGGITFGKRF